MKGLELVGETGGIRLQGNRVSAKGDNTNPAFETLFEKLVDHPTHLCKTLPAIGQTAA